MKDIIVFLSGQVFVGSLKGFGVGGWAPSNPFSERIEKPVRKIGPPLTQLHGAEACGVNLRTIYVSIKSGETST